MKRRNSAVIILYLFVLGLAASISLLWFFSSPEGASRKQATASLVTFAVRTLTLSAVTGFAAMATLEVAKRLLRLRGRFFLGRVAGPEFLRLAQPVRPAKVPAKAAGQSQDKAQTAGQPAPAAGESQEPADANRAADVRRLDIPLEQLMAQLGYAADQALNRLFTDQTDQTEHNDSPQTRRSKLNPEKRDTDDYRFLVSLLGQAALTNSETNGDPTMLRLKTQAALDDLQVNVGNAWRWQLRLASCVLSVLFALAALIYVPVPPGTKVAALASSFLLGGFLAGFFRDLSAIAERLRGLCSRLRHTTSRYESLVAD